MFIILTGATTVGKLYRLRDHFFTSGETTIVYIHKF